MPGFLLHEGATVKCSHDGSATPTVPFPRVKVSQQSITTMPNPYRVTGCKLPPKEGGPCQFANWTSAATRIQAGGAPVLMFDSQAMCTPPPFPLLILRTQIRVQGT
jgi:hypothetical protein